MQSFVALTDKSTEGKMFLLVTEIISVLQIHKDNELGRHTKILMRNDVVFNVEEDAEKVMRLLSRKELLIVCD